MFTCCLVVSTSAIDCLERLISEMTYYASSGMLNPTHSLTLFSVPNKEDGQSEISYSFHLASSINTNSDIPKIQN